MSKRVLISVVVLVFSGQAFGQQVVNYYFPAPATSFVIDPVPAEGLILTDFLITGPNDSTFVLEETVDGETQPIARLSIRNLSLSLQSGIVLQGGSSLEGIAVGGDPFPVTISGYIPGTGRGDVPAISGIGLGIMLLFVVAVGGFVFKRVRLQEA